MTRGSAQWYPDPERAIWEHALESPCDVLVIDKSVVPPPLAQSITTLCSRATSPAVIVLTPDHDALEEAD